MNTSRITKDGIRETNKTVVNGLFIVCGVVGTVVEGTVVEETIGEERYAKVEGKTDAVLKTAAVPKMDKAELEDKQLDNTSTNNVTSQLKGFSRRSIIFMCGN